MKFWNYRRSINRSYLLFPAVHKGLMTHTASFHLEFKHFFTRFIIINIGLCVVLQICFWCLTVFEK